MSTTEGTAPSTAEGDAAQLLAAAGVQAATGAVVPTKLLSKWKAWALDAGERVARTFVQAFLGALGVGQFTSLSAYKAAALAGFAAVLSLVMSTLAAAGTTGATASFVPQAARASALHELAVLFASAQTWLAGILKPAPAATPIAVHVYPQATNAPPTTGPVVGGVDQHLAVGLDYASERYGQAPPSDDPTQPTAPTLTQVGTIEVPVTVAGEHAGTATVPLLAGEPSPAPLLGVASHTDEPHPSEGLTATAGAGMADYDKGGILPEGLTVAENKTGAPEAVVPGIPTSAPQPPSEPPASPEPTDTAADSTPAAQPDVTQLADEAQAAVDRLRKAIEGTPPVT